MIRQQDGPATLFYLDPPCLHETRVTTDDYAHEMTTEQHVELLATLSQIRGLFLLSGYRNELYDEYADRHGWRCETRAIDCKASGRVVKEKRTEMLWTIIDTSSLSEPFKEMLSDIIDYATRLYDSLRECTLDPWRDYSLETVIVDSDEVNASIIPQARTRPCSSHSLWETIDRSAKSRR